jgi:F-type H+-transporting ATPase subunit b
MSTFFTSFGVNAISLAFYLLMFALVLLALRRWAFGPILRTIQSRQDKINESLDQAEDALKLVKANRERAEKLIWEAGTEAREIISRAERTAVEIHEDARKEARLEADLIVTKARQEIERERQAAVNELRRLTVDLALTAASRVIGESLSDDKSRQLAEEAVRQAELRS